MAKADIDAFRAWARTQRSRQDAIGDFCRDFVVDECSRECRTISGLDWHLKTAHLASEDALKARHEAWREYATESGHPAYQRTEGQK